MTGKVLELKDILREDRLATEISNKWLDWDMRRANKKADWLEVRRYKYAIDTTDTSNSKLPWKNKTTIPKICQISDNLHANYTATMFPITQRKWLIWEANNKDSNSVDKKNAITNYMNWVINQPSFKHEMDKIVLDYIEFGNCFATVQWLDQRVEQPPQSGYVGPVIRRINPLDMVMNPIAENFESSPKIVRSVISVGELKELLTRLSNDDNKAEYEELWEYLKELRNKATEFQGDFNQQNSLYVMEGFTSFREYLQSGSVEVLTFYGDLYDPVNDEFYKNHVITVVDRHVLIGKKPNPSFFGYPPIFHAPWRKRQDNLWGMGPLDNLVGLQYRMDHVENMKADVFDLITYPVQKVKGFVEDFTWQPGEKIYVSEDGDVDLVCPDVNALNCNFEIDAIERRMEEMAGAPREAMGFRTPGEKTKYEVQRLENAASRLFQNKIKQFEEQILEPLLNAMLELARRNMEGTQYIKVFDDEFKSTTFKQLGVEDIIGSGRIKPIAARHFAEQADMVQNLNNLAGSPLWPFVQPHFSSIETAKFLECTFNLEDYGIVKPFVALTEQAEGQKFMNVLQEQVANEATTATGLGEDYDMAQGMSPEAMQGQPPQPQAQQGAY